MKMSTVERYAATLGRKVATQSPFEDGNWWQAAARKQRYRGMSRERDREPIRGGLALLGRNGYHAAHGTALRAER